MQATTERSLSGAHFRSEHQETRGGRQRPAGSRCISRCISAVCGEACNGAKGLITAVCSRPLVLHSWPDLQGDLLPELDVSLISSQQGASLPACSMSAMAPCIGQGSADMPKAVLPKDGSTRLTIRTRTKPSRCMRDATLEPV